MVQWAVSQSAFSEPRRPQRRKGRPKRRTKGRTARTSWHAVVACGILALILGSYVLVAPWRASTSKSATGTQAGTQSALQPEVSTQPPTLPGKPAGTGRILIPEKQTVACRELGFDNYSGRFSDYGTVACNADRGAAVAPPNYATPISRLDAIRRTFSPR